MKNVNWTKWSSISEIISSIAIVLTLMYLALQTQQNTAALQSSARQETLNAELSLIYSLIDHPQINASISNPEIELTPELQTQIMLSEVAYFRIRENLWLQNRNGALDDQTWIAYRDQFIDNIKTNPNTRIFWKSLSELGGGGFDNDFIAEIDRMLDR